MSPPGRSTGFGLGLYRRPTLPIVGADSGGTDRTISGKVLPPIRPRPFQAFIRLLATMIWLLHTHSSSHLQAESGAIRWKPTPAQCAFANHPNFSSLLEPLFS